MSAATSQPMFSIIDGRHRYEAVVQRGAPRELRCDVITPHVHALRVIPIDQLVVDPDVQLDFAYDARRAASMALNYDDRKVGVLTVVETGLPVAEKAAIKLGLDFERRRVSAVESFLVSVKKGDEASTRIMSTAINLGFEIGKLKGGKPYHRIEAVVSLKSIYKRAGEDGLRRTLTLNTHWRGDPKSNTSLWLMALYLLVRDGYDDAMTPSSWERMKEAVPALEIRRAQGEVQSLARGNDNTIPAVSYQIAISLRKRARLRVLPLGRPTGSDGSVSTGGPGRDLR